MAVLQQFHVDAFVQSYWDNPMVQWLLVGSQAPAVTT
jgi:hypothetical protein